LSRNYPQFYGPEISLAHSLVPINNPYPERTVCRLYHKNHFLKIHLNIILPYKPGSSKWNPSFRCPSQNPVNASLFSIRATCLAHISSRFYHTKNLGEGYLILGFWLRIFYPPATSFLFSPNNRFNSCFSITQYQHPSLNVWHQVSNPCDR
jgi:hypothetical protein